MQVHPDIAALRGDPASQRRSRDHLGKVLADWHQQEAVAAFRRECEGFASGGAVSGFPALAALMGDRDTAREFVDAFAHPFIAALRAEPLGEAPFRHNTGEGFARIQLLQSGGVTLSLCVYEPMNWKQAPETVRFVDCESHEIVVSGAARGRAYRFLELGQGIAACDRRWQSGDRIERKPMEHARHVLQVEKSMLVLQLTRAPRSPGPSCEYRLSDGALVRETSGDKRASEQVMALGVLGAMGAATAIAPIRDFARQDEHDRDARWEAIRQLLALDSAAGVAVLNQLAEESADILSRPAAKLREQLIGAYPQLQAVTA